MSKPIDQLQGNGTRYLAAVLASMLMVFLAGFIAGGEGQYFSLSALEIVPFSATAVMAYAGQRLRWLNVLCLLILIATLAIAAFIVIGLGIWAVVGPDPTTLAEPSSLPPADLELLREAVTKLGIGALASLLLACSAFIGRVRQLVARVLPIDPESFIHTIALVLVTSITLLSFLPLIVLATPAITSISSAMSEQGQSFSLRSPDGMLLDEVYGLLWLLPAAVVAVGYGLRRNFRQTLDRLGLHKPSWFQVWSGLGCAAALVVAVGLLSPGIEWVWQALGWPSTDSESFLQLAEHFFSPLGAVVIGVTAGLGEELVFRGVLQPRLGLWLSNLFFTSVHAFQYNWDTLILIFLLGMVFGIVREKSNTTTCAIVHGAYDFLLIMAIVLEIPGLAQ